MMTLLLMRNRRKGSVWVLLPQEVVDQVITMAYGNVYEGCWHGVAVDMSAWREEDEKRLNNQRHGKAPHRSCYIV